MKINELNKTESFTYKATRIATQDATDYAPWVETINITCISITDATYWTTRDAITEFLSEL